MAVNRCTFSNDLKSKDLHYSDEFFKLKSEKVIPSDSFTFDSYEAFKDINDFKTNNYSNLFLINKKRNSQWLEPQVRQRDQLNGLATTISWYSANLTAETERGSWLYFSKNYEMFDINVTTVEALVTYDRPQSNYSNYIFYLEFLDENVCRISHTFGDLRFYLCVEDDKTIHFLKEPKDDKEKFIYQIDGQMLKLYKRVVHNTYDEVGDIIASVQKLYLLGIQRDDNKQATLRLWDDTKSDSGDVITYVTNNLLEFDFYIDSSWVSYDRSKYISSINPKKSAYNLTTQALIHHQYNKEDGFNFIPLKNNQTYKGNTIRGNNMTYSDENYPDVDYRTYTSIQSGLKQEKGNDNIILTFNFTDQEYTVEQGDDLIFTIPEKSLEQTNGLQPLWPYKYININDTKFIKNGAFGSNVPFFADKVKKLQGHKTMIVDEKGNKLSPNNGTYLCSWLYKKNPESAPIWLDRYYYPDIISRKEALKGDAYNQSFENIMDKAYVKDVQVLSQDASDDQKAAYEKQVEKVKEIRGKIHRNTYFDKVSDLVIEPANTYRYQRISNEMIDEVNENLKPYLISTGKNRARKDVNIDELFWFDNQNYYKLNYKDWNKTNSINYNMDIYLSRKKRMGIQLFGTDYKDGFNIQNRKDLVPFHYWATDKVIYLLNNKFEAVHQFDLGEKYDDTILKVFLGDVFDDVVVVTGIWMYIFSYDLRLKSRIDMTASQANGKANGIKDLENISVLNIQTDISNEYDKINEIISRRNKHNNINHDELSYKDYQQGLQLDCVKCLQIKKARQKHISLHNTMVKPQELPQDASDEQRQIYEAEMEQWNAFVQEGIKLYCQKCGFEIKEENTSVEVKISQAASISMVNYPYGHTNISLANKGLKQWGKGTFEAPYTKSNYSYTFKKNFIASTKIYINEDTISSGSVLIPSRLSEEICKSNPILYKNNLYIPVNQKIMKIIFCPDVANDFEYFNQEDMGEYPAAARYLTSDEFFLNYTKTGDGSATQNISTEQGFIEVQNRIKHIYISEQGTIYGLNYDEFSISYDGDTIYGLYASDRYIASGGWWWLFHDSLSKMQADTSTSKYAEFASPNSIDKVKFNERGEMCLIRNFHNLSDNENEDNNKRMDIYDKTKQRIYTFDLTPFDEIVSLDSYNFIDDAHQEQTVFVALLKAVGMIYKVMYYSDNKTANSMSTQLPFNVLPTFYQTVNSNVLLRYRDYNSLYFNLHVPSHYTYDYIATIKWDLSDIQQGWYNINVMIDLDAAEFEVRINDIIYQTINEKTHSWFKPYVSSNGTTFDSTYYFGCIGKKYGTVLNKILKNAPFDPYVCKNSKVDNLTIHNRRLDYYEYQAMRMKNKGINRLLLTLPCGNRNGIDQIVRYFKYNSSSAISNKVKINITGTGLQTEGQFDMLRKEIQAVLASNKDCLVDVKDIEFVEIN